MPQIARSPFVGGRVSHSKARCVIATGYGPKDYSFATSAMSRKQALEAWRMANAAEVHSAGPQVEFARADDVCRARVEKLGVVEDPTHLGLHYVSARWKSAVASFCYVDVDEVPIYPAVPVSELVGAPHGFDVAQTRIARELLLNPTDYAFSGLVS